MLPSAGVRYHVAPSKRSSRACATLRRVVGPPRVDAERLGLYAKWHAGRERARGWEANPQTRDRYALEFAFPHPCAREAASVAPKTLRPE